MGQRLRRNTMASGARSIARSISSAAAAWRSVRKSTMPFRCRAEGASGTAHMMWSSSLSASVRRPPSRNSPASFISSSRGTGTCGIGGWTGTNDVVIIRFTTLVQAVSEAVDHRLQDRDHWVQLPQIMAGTEPGSIVQLLGHLRVAWGVRHTPILLEAPATLVEIRADEVQHATHVAGHIVHHVLVANRQVPQRHLGPVVLDEVHSLPLVARNRLQRIGAEIAMGQVVGEHG